jgi:hypothetical protein
LRNVLLSSIFVIAAAAAVFAQAVPSEVDDTVVEIYLARDDGKGKAGEQAVSFGPSDIPIHCVVLLPSAETASVRMNLVVVDVPGVRPDTRVVSATYVTRDLQDRVNFTGRPHGKWVAGRYRVDIFVNDKRAGSREFTVEKTRASEPPKVPTPNGKADARSRLAGPVPSDQ